MESSEMEKGHCAHIQILKDGELFRDIRPMLRTESGCDGREYLAIGFEVRHEGMVEDRKPERILPRLRAR